MSTKISKMPGEGGLDKKFKPLIGKQLDIQRKLKPIERRGVVNAYQRCSVLSFRQAGKRETVYAFYNGTAFVATASLKAISCSTRSIVGENCDISCSICIREYTSIKFNGSSHTYR